MCGVNGIFAFNRAASAPSREELITTRDAMRARGPDGEGEWGSPDGRCLLGHRRLAIIDLSDKAAQPMTSADGRFVIVFNGEIYNYRELRKELEAEGATFRSESDTEVLLHLYSQEGREMLPRLRGMFAFAIWDAAKGGLFLARDAFGIKPLYTANDGWTLRFASQVKALLAGGKVSREQEPAGLVGFYLWGSVPEPFTLFREIRALPAGHSQWIDAAGPREPVPYFDVAKLFSAAPAPKGNFAEVLRSAVRQSVEAHLVADVEVGLFLSAGIDSGALLGAVDEPFRGGLRTITLGFDEFAGTSEDEVPLAAEVATQFGARHIVRRVGRDEFRGDLPQILEAMDQPSIDGINSWFVAKAAREAGLKVALSGLGADELLGGYPSFRDIPRWRRRFGPFARVPGSGRMLRKLVRVAKPGLRETSPKSLGMFDHAGSWGGAYLLRRSLFLPHELQSVLPAETVKVGLARLRPLQQLDQALARDPGSDMARISTLEFSFYLRNQLLRDVDWAGMAHSVEIRVPFVDTVMLAAVAPFVVGLKQGEGKLTLSRAPATGLPAAVSARSKSGFGVPVGKWLLTASDESADLNKGLASRRWSQVVLETAFSQ